MEHQIDIVSRFCNLDGKITELPRKAAKRKAVLQYLASKFELNQRYTEPQVNEICNMWHTFGDYCMLRRYLVDEGLLCRTIDNSYYWRSKLKD